MEGSVSEWRGASPSTYGGEDLNLEETQLLSGSDDGQVVDAEDKSSVYSPSGRSPRASSSYSGLSVTPKQHAALRDRKSLSATPTQGDTSFSTVMPSPSYPLEPHPGEEWGDDAVMRWDGEIVEGDDASSVAPEEAGVSGDEEQEWGREAMLDWAWSPTQDEGGSHVDDESESGEDQVGERESDDQLRARGMPDYSTWELKKLQVGASETSSWV